MREAGAYSESSAVGVLLQREGLYSSHLHEWRQEVATLEKNKLVENKRGPKPNPSKTADHHAVQLEQENAKLRKNLGRTEKIIHVQKTLADSHDPCR